MSGRKVCRINGSKIADTKQIHDQLAADLGFPDYYGRNLDALWDILTKELEGPAQIEIVNAGLAGERLGPAFGALVEVLKEAATENGDLTIAID